MKYFASLFLLASLTGCSRAYVRQWGGGQVEACCPSGKIFCTREKLDELAKENCGGSATAIGGQKVNSGAAISDGLGGLNIRNTSDNCVTYSCDSGRSVSAIESPDFTKK